jgi:hypothetical protein
MYCKQGGILMTKTNLLMSFCCSLFLGASAFAPIVFASDVETFGNLKVYGVIESSNGGFKFPDGSTWTTGSMDGLNFNVGFVVDSSGSNAGTLDSGAIKFGTGGTGEGIASRRLNGDNQNGLDFYTNNAARLSITNNGNVGINTRTPGFALDVRSTKNTVARFGYTGGSTFIGSNGPLLGLNGYWDSTSSGWKYGDAGSAGLIWWSDNGFRFLTAPAGTAGATFFPATRMFLSNDGKLGIGTTSPAQALSVVGMIESTNGVRGSSSSGDGVHGESTFSSGVYGQSSQSVGVLGYTAASGAQNAGVKGLSQSDARGVFGEGRSTGAGVYGENNGSGYGVVGYASGSALAAGQFISATSGTALVAESPAGTQVLKADAAGIHAGPGMTGTPLAYGRFNSTGSRTAGSSNISCGWDVTKYQCQISGESYFYGDYVTVVTPDGINIAIPVVNSSVGRLIVTFYNLSGTAMQPNGFSVTVYKQ